MARAGVDIEKIVDIAVEITETSGIKSVSLKKISERLNVSSPSLYNHVSSLAELRARVSYRALEMVKEAMLKEALGKSDTDIIRAIGKAYIRFAQEHLHLYETIQWMNIWDDTEGKNIFSDIMELAWDASVNMGLNETEANYAIRGLRSLANGFANIESHHGFGHDAGVHESFEYAMDMLIQGINSRSSQ